MDSASFLRFLFTDGGGSGTSEESSPLPVTSSLAVEGGTLPCGVGNDLELEGVPEVMGGLSVLDPGNGVISAVHDFGVFPTPSDFSPVGGFPALCEVKGLVTPFP